MNSDSMLLWCRSLSPRCVVPPSPALSSQGTFLLTTCEQKKEEEEEPRTHHLKLKVDHSNSRVTSRQFTKVVESRLHADGHADHCRSIWTPRNIASSHRTVSHSRRSMGQPSPFTSRGTHCWRGDSTTIHGALCRPSSGLSCSSLPAVGPPSPPWCGTRGSRPGPRHSYDFRHRSR